MKILITGGAGFIGSNLALEMQKEKGNDITIIDNLSSGNQENLDGFNGGSFSRSKSGKAGTPFCVAPSVITGFKKSGSKFSMKFWAGVLPCWPG